MAAITASLVKELREKSGAGMMDCKKALNETGGDMEAAVDWLRQKGLAAAAKKAGRVAADGLVGMVLEGAKGAVVEVNSETDFVARNDIFQKFVAETTKLALGVDGDLDKLLAADFPGTGRTVDGEIKEMVGTIGENMNVRRAACLSVDTGVVGGYIHTQVAEGMGKIGVLVALESTGDATVLSAFARQVAMHIAATNPQAVSVDELDPAVVARERDVLIEQAKESGKPAEIAEKMVEGRIRKFYQEVVLLQQAYVMNGDQTVEQAVEEAAKAAGAPVKLVAFARVALGEGIEKKEEDFAAEVAAVAGK